MIEFKYFAEPENFAFLNTEIDTCEVCGEKKTCFDTSSYFGEGELEAVCDTCMAEGKLLELDICGNDIPFNANVLLSPELNTDEHTNMIAYCTPKLPAWQAMQWPIKNGDFCRFIKLASRNDFSGKEELFRAIPDDYKCDHSADDFWEMIPCNKITNLDDGNYDTSFYLFMSGDEKIVIWDCN